MKKYIIVLSIVFASCSTVKIEEQIVQDFVKEKNLKNDPYINGSYLIKEAISNKKVLDYYLMAYQDKNLKLSNKRIGVVPSKITSWPIDEKEIKEIIAIHKKDSVPYYWNIINFKHLEIPIMDKKELLSKAVKEIIPFSSTGHVISKPILSLNKKYALIQYSLVFCSGGVSPRYYVLEKVKNKWLVKLELDDATF